MSEALDVMLSVALEDSYRASNCVAPLDLGVISNPMIWGGPRNTASVIFGGSVGFTSSENIIRSINLIDWTMLGSVQLFLKEEHDAYFKVFMFRNNTLVQVLEV